MDHPKPESLGNTLPSTEGVIHLPIAQELLQIAHGQTSTWTSREFVLLPVKQTGTGLR